MTKQWKRLWALALAIMSVFSLCLTAYAHDVPDLTRRGSITVTARKGEQFISGGTLTLYRVAEVAEEDGNYFFRAVGDFADCGESFDTLEDAADMALRLVSLADNAKEVSTKPIGDDGSVTFENLELGLYLVVQYQAAPGYARLAPFLVSLPYMENGKYEYDLKASPKPGLDQEPEPTTEPSTDPTKPEQNLPQTGQLWWPVPVLACGGLLLFAIGMALNRRREPDER